MAQLLGGARKQPRSTTQRLILTAAFLAGLSLAAYVLLSQ
jgi:hypothetical protein